MWYSSEESIVNVVCLWPACNTTCPESDRVNSTSIRSGDQAVKIRSPLSRGRTGRARCLFHCSRLSNKNQTKSWRPRCASSPSTHNAITTPLCFCHFSALFKVLYICTGKVLILMEGYLAGPRAFPAQSAIRIKYTPGTPTEHVRDSMINEYQPRLSRF